MHFSSLSLTHKLKVSAINYKLPSKYFFNNNNKNNNNSSNNFKKLDDFAIPVIDLKATADGGTCVSIKKKAYTLLCFLYCSGRADR